MAKTLSDILSSTLSAYTRGSHRYMDEFVQQWQSASDLLTLGIYPNAKEITESYAAFNATRNHLKFVDRGDPNVTLVAVGDGRTPRTAALFAFKTNWKCISIDPMLNESKIPFWESNIQRLKCVPEKIEDYEVTGGDIVIAAVHSHAPLSAILENISGNRSLIAIPCCVPYEHSVPPSKQYRDAGIWSPKNLVKVWKAI